MARRHIYFKDSRHLNINLDEIIRAKLGTIFAREFVSDMSKREMKWQHSRRHRHMHSGELCR